MALSIMAGFWNKLLALSVTPYIWRGEVPQNPVYPLTVFDLVDEPPADHTHDAQVVGPRSARVQIEVYAESASAADAAMEEYFAELAGFSGAFGSNTSPSEFADVEIFDEGNAGNMDFAAEPTLRTIYGRRHDFMIVY
jgi:hypothetical protein